MKTVSYILFSITLLMGASLGYFLKSLDAPSTLKPFFYVDICRSDKQILSFPVQEKDAQFFGLPKGVVVTNLVIRYP